MKWFKFVWRKSNNTLICIYIVFNAALGIIEWFVFILKIVWCAMICKLFQFNEDFDKVVKTTSIIFNINLI